MPEQHRVEYHGRFNKVLDYIQQNLEKDLTLEQLAQVANFSKFHFHRLFRAYTGETVTEHCRRLRLEKAAQLLVFDRNRAITQVALHCGFSSSANFAKAFKLHFGFTPTQARMQLDFDQRGVKSKIGKLNSNSGKEYPDDCSETALHIQLHRENINMHVTIEQIPDRFLAYVRTIGPYSSELIKPAFGKLLQWAGSHDLIGPDTTMLGISRSNPNITPDENCQYDASITVPKDTQPRGGISTQVLQGGKTAVYHTVVTHGQFQIPWSELLGQWLPESGFQPDDRPPYEVYLNNGGDDPEGKWIVDICLPIKPL